MMGISFSLMVDVWMPRPRRKFRRGLPFDLRLDGFSFSKEAVVCQR
jgi:hypothetical protein